jgi:hypothetical protein
MESFFKTLEVERIYRVRYENRAQARLDIVTGSRASTTACECTRLLDSSPRSRKNAASWLHDLLYVETRQGHLAGRRFA